MEIYTCYLQVDICENNTIGQVVKQHPVSMAIRTDILGGGVWVEVEVKISERDGTGGVPKTENTKESQEKNKNHCHGIIAVV